MSYVSSNLYILGQALWFYEFRADRKNKIHPGLWLAGTLSTSPLKPLDRIQRNLTGRSEKQDGRLSLWLAYNIIDFSSETAGRNSTKLDRKQDLIVLFQVCDFRVDEKNKMAA